MPDNVAFIILLSLPIILLIVAIIGFAVFCVNHTSKYRDKMIATSRYEINTRNQAGINISDELNKFITDCFVDYQVMILIPRQELYINTDREQEIKTDLGYKVAERISPNFLDRLSMYYNPASIDKVIADKITIVVTNYCLEHNRTILIDDTKNKG